MAHGLGPQDAIDHASHRLRIGLATCWWRPRQITWSSTPWNLRAGLIDTGATIVDIDVERRLPLKAALAVAYGLLPGRHRKYGLLERRLTERAVHVGVRRHRVDVVLGTADVTVPAAVPSFAYQDMGFAVARAHYHRVGADNLAMVPASERTLRRLDLEQRSNFRSLAGVLTMGSWYADFLVQELGLSPERVHVVGGGVSDVHREQAVRKPAGGTRMLFIGREWQRKGGDLALRACQSLRSRGRPVTLTVAGPSRWSEQTALPDWVRFLGPVPRHQLAPLYASHDLFLLPSRFEPYGLVFLEAQAMGVPCVGRRAFAMPELVPEGIAGRLAEDVDDPDHIADVVAATLDDEALYANMPARADEVRARHAWSAVARRILDVLGPTPSARAPESPRAPQIGGGTNSEPGSSAASADGP